METIKQKKIAQLIKEVLSEIFQRESLSMVQGGMMTISHVIVSPDLLVAKIYLSFFQIKNPTEIVESLQRGKIEERGTHAELLQADGVYKRLVHMQML